MAQSEKDQEESGLQWDLMRGSVGSLFLKVSDLSYGMLILLCSKFHSFNSISVSFVGGFHLSKYGNSNSILELTFGTESNNDDSADSYVRDLRKHK